MEYEINELFNNLVHNAVQCTTMTQDRERILDQSTIEEQKIQINEFIIDQVVQLLFSNDEQKKQNQKVQQLNQSLPPQPFPPYLIQKSFSCFIENVIMFDGKDSLLKQIFIALKLLFKKVGAVLDPKKKQANVQELLFKTLNQLCSRIILPGVPLPVQNRSGLLVCYILELTKLKPQDSSQLLKACQYLGLSGAKQSTQAQALQICSTLYNKNKVDQDKFFNIIAYLSKNSKHKEIRRKAIRAIQVPSFLADPILHQKLRDERPRALRVQKQILIKIIFPRTIDSDNEVRLMAFKKLAALKLTIEDFESMEERMIMLKEGLTDKDQRILKACIDFVYPSFIREEIISVKVGDLKSYIDEKTLQDRQRQSKRDSSFFISKRRSEGFSQKGNEDEAMDMNKKIQILKSTFTFTKVIELLDLQKVFISQYFAQFLHVVVQASFLVLQTHRERARKQRLTLMQKQQSVQGLLSDLEKVIRAEEKEVSEEMILAEFANSLIKKYVSIAKETVKIENCDVISEMDEEMLEEDQVKDKDGSLTLINDLMHSCDVSDNELRVEELLFLRHLYEVSKFKREERSIDFQQKIKLILPSLSDYKLVFRLLEELQPQPETHMQANRLMLGEWLKLAVELQISDNDIECNNLISFLGAFIGRIQNSFDDFKHLLQSELYQIDLTGRRINENQNIGEVLDYLKNSNEDNLEFEIREFLSLGQHIDTQEYMKPYSFEMLVRDADDVSKLAVMIIKKFMGDDTGNQFMTEILQTVSDVMETIEDKPASKVEQQVTQQKSSAAFGLLSQVPENPIEKQSESLNYIELEKKYNQKQIDIQEKMRDITETDYNEEQFAELVLAAKNLVAVLEEIKLKKKLTLKRALSLCLVLLKQCRANVNDKNLIEICEGVIGPAIENTNDQDIQLLAIECIGLLSLLQKDLFDNYANIYFAILQDAVESNIDDQFDCRLTIIALKSTIDGLIFFGSNEITEKLQNMILSHFLFCQDENLRQIAIEGTCKLLFSIHISKPKPQIGGCKIEQEEQPVDESFNNISDVIQQLIIQWFDKKVNPPSAVVRQALSMFFSHYILFSEQNCLCVVKALLQIVFVHLVETQLSESEKGKLIKKGCKMIKKEVSSDFDSEYSDGTSTLPGSQIIQNLDISKMIQTFLLLLDRSFIRQQTPVRNFKFTKSFQSAILFGVCHMNNEVFKKVKPAKTVISDIIARINPAEFDDWRDIPILKDEIAKNVQRFVKNPPSKLKDFLVFLDKQAAKLSELKEEEEEDEANPQELFGLDLQKCKDAYVSEAIKKKHFILHRKHFKPVEERYLDRLNSSYQSPEKRIKRQRPQSSSQRRRRLSSSQERRKGYSQKAIKTKTEHERGSLGQIPELEESNRQIYSSEKPRKLVKFDNNVQISKKESQDVKIILREEDEQSQEDIYSLRAGSKMTKLSQKHAKMFQLSKAKQKEEFVSNISNKSPDSSMWSEDRASYLRISKNKATGRIIVETSSKKLEVPRGSRDIFKTEKNREQPEVINLNQTFEEIDKENETKIYKKPVLQNVKIEVNPYSSSSEQINMRRAQMSSQELIEIDQSDEQDSDESDDLVILNSRADQQKKKLQRARRRAITEPEVAVVSKPKVFEKKEKHQSRRRDSSSKENSSYVSNGSLRRANRRLTK